MIEVIPKQKGYRTEQLKSLGIKDCFSMYPAGDDNFEIFLITDYPEDSGIPAVSLKTGHYFFFTEDFSVYPLDLTVAYSHQPE